MLWGSIPSRSTLSNLEDSFDPEASFDPPESFEPESLADDDDSLDEDASEPDPLEPPVEDVFERESLTYQPLPLNTMPTG